MRTFLLVFSLCFVFCMASLAGDDTAQPLSDRKQKIYNRAFVDGVIVGNSYNARLISPEDLYVTNSSYPWLYPHLVPEKGLPKPLAVDKWTQPIKITFGMPNDLEPFEEITKEGKKPHSISGKNGFYRTKEGEWNGVYYALNDLIADIKGYKAFPVVESEIKGFSEVVAPVIGLPVSYLSPDEETKENYGNIRINLFKDDTLAAVKWGKGLHPGLFKRENRPKPSFTTAWSGVGQPRPYDFPELERLLNTRTSFNNSLHHVEGYFLSNENNEIQMAVCYIWEGHQPDVLRGLIRECLLRSLGFPGVTNRHSEHGSLLKGWNGSTPWPEYVDYLQKPFALFDNDQSLLELLYSKEIQAGMDYLTLRNVLIKNAQQ